MTVTQEAPAEAPDALSTPRLRTVLRRAAFWIGAGLVVLLFVLLIASVSRSAAQGDPLAIDNAAPGGSMALAEVLGRQGVEVIATDNLDDTEAAADDPAQTTILLYDPSLILDRDRLERVAELADRIVLVDPGFDELRVLAPGVAQAGNVDGPLDAECDLPAAQRAEQISGDLVGYRIVEDDANATGCFGSGDDVFSVIRVGEGVTVLGAVGALTNGQIAQDGNAALVFNLLGEHERLIWYLPSFADFDAGGAAPPPPPAWLIPAIALLFGVGIAAAFWRGRRLGPLVIENLPVTVRASETMLGRARLYEKSGARLRALDALRVGTIQRIAKAAGLSRHATVEEIVATTAALTGRPPSDVRRLLLEYEPGGDADLVQQSDQLLTLEQDVTKAVRGR